MASGGQSASGTNGVNASGASSEVDDYMSEALIQSIRESEQQSQPRQLGRKRKQVENPVSVKKLMKESMQRGMDTRIDETNVGFKLLAKLGYQEGSGLGKHGQGIVVPLRAEPKRDVTSGLGIEEPIRKKKQEIDTYIQESKSYRMQTLAAAEEAFPDSIKERLKQRTALGHLVRARRAIMDLDTRTGKESHDLWPESSQEDHDQSQLEPQATEPDVSFQLERCVYYLREEYSYCMFCGCQYSDLKELADLCPGPFEEAHDEL